ncbi:MAG: hypothetical protein COA79_08070 [Planctomycetota bacterium]|nr:MAG: hypothetical protein COA79_08070 [Planctomycetota bacterium]
MSIYKGITVDGNAIEVNISDSKISKIKQIENSEDLPLIGIPLVDAQNNGGIGYNYNHLSENIDALPEMIKFYRSHGIGRILATITTNLPEVIRKSGSALVNAMESDSDVDVFYPGFFHEGIYMSKLDGWRGGHQTKFIKDPDYHEFSETNKACHNKIKLVNIAPEEPGAMSFIEKAVADGVRVSLGHACPNAEQVAEAVKCGATMVTHFGNGANPTIHRHTNPFWSFLAHDELSLGIIGDSFHLPADLIKTAYKVKGKEKIVMVSDCAGLSGLRTGLHKDGKITIESNGYMHHTGEEILAASWHQLDKGVEVLCNLGWSLADAWRQCSEVPANQFNIKTDRIEEGASANFVLSKYSEASGLVLEKVLFKGEEIIPTPVNPQ